MSLYIEKQADIDWPWRSEATMGVWVDGTHKDEI